MRYFIGFLLSIGVVVLAFVLILHIFSGGSSNKNVQPLINYANTDTTVQFTELSPLVNDQTYDGFTINIGASESIIQTLQGYNQTITNTQTFNNNETGFADFLGALDLAGFQKGNTSPSKSDSRGYCATGDTYVFQTITSSGTSQRWWWTSCNEGNFGGNAKRVISLFEQQIPNFQTITENLAL
jgi:hypothetical protein